MKREKAVKREDGEERNEKEDVEITSGGGPGKHAHDDGYRCPKPLTSADLGALCLKSQSRRPAVVAVGFLTGACEVRLLLNRKRLRCQ